MNFCFMPIWNVKVDALKENIDMHNSNSHFYLYFHQPETFCYLETKPNAALTKFSSLCFNCLLRFVTKKNVDLRFVSVHLHQFIDSFQKIKL